MVHGAVDDRARAGGAMIEPLTARLGPAAQRADGTSATSTVVPVRLRPAELASLDARRLPGESRSDAVRRILGG